MPTAAPMPPTGVVVAAPVAVPSPVTTPGVDITIPLLSVRISL